MPARERTQEILKIWRQVRRQTTTDAVTVQFDVNIERGISSESSTQNCLGKTRKMKRSLTFDPTSLTPSLHRPHPPQHWNSSLMRPNCFSIRRFGYTTPRWLQQRRSLLTVAIETSCDDTSVAVLEKHENNSATLHFHSKITSDNRSHGGIYPIIAHESHQKHLATLVHEALRSLPAIDKADAHPGNALLIGSESRPGHGTLRKKPDFVTATRGPGMRAGLITGVDTAKGLAVGWQVPFLGVNHMQAHALTPRLVSALDSSVGKSVDGDPAFPFLTLLVSGGHTMLVHSKSLCDHEILANTVDLAVGDMLDKCGRDILPAEMISSAENVMYARLLESFAFPDEQPNYKHEVRDNVGFKSGYSWVINPPYLSPGDGGPKDHAHKFSLAGIGSSARRIVEKKPGMDETELRCVAREGMRIAFRHLASRILFALDLPGVKGVDTLVVSGGVACNKYLKYVLRESLNQNGHEAMQLVFPPPKYCTDNAAMVAWTGIEMWEAGWRTNLDAMAVRKWAIDPKAEDGGILGLDGWTRVTS